MDSGWLKALELPAKITGGVLAACVIALYGDNKGLLSLSKIGPWFRPVLQVIAVFAGALFAANILSDFLVYCRGYQAKIAAEKEKVEDERKKAAAEEAAKKKSVSHLDKLSEEETYIVADALKKNTPSIKWWLHSGGAAQLCAKGLLQQLPGQYQTNHWPFIFYDFAWEAIEERRESLLKQAEKFELESKKRR